MRRFLICAAPLALAACGGEPAEEAAPVEPVVVEPAAPASANGSPTGTYSATAADGTVTLTTIRDDWTYVDTDAGGNVLAEGTWNVTDGKTCFMPTTEGVEAMCYTESEPQFDGSFTATPDSGEPLSVARMPDVADGAPLDAAPVDAAVQ